MQIIDLPLRSSYIRHLPLRCGALKLNIMILKQYWAHSGYDAEEVYFAKINRDLIDRIKADKQGKGFNPEAKDAPLATVIPFPSQDERLAQKKKAA